MRKLQDVYIFVCKKEIQVLNIFVMVCAILYKQYIVIIIILFGSIHDILLIANNESIDIYIITLSAVFHIY